MIFYCFIGALVNTNIGVRGFTEYAIDSVINWQPDAPPFEIIAGISLATDGTFKLHPHEKSKAQERQLFPSTLVEDRYTLYGRNKRSVATQHAACSASKVFHYAQDLKATKAMT